MAPSLTLLAAGSLKSAFLPLLARFQQLSGIQVEAQFGPAGLLRERIEGGERCSLFACANTEHPQALLQAGLAIKCCSFAANRLMLTVRRTPDTDRADWLALLHDSRLRLATSTPGCDPSGDYTAAFARLEASYPGLGRTLMARAQQLVGGRASLTVPSGATAGMANWRRLCRSVYRLRPLCGSDDGERAVSHVTHSRAVEYLLRISAGRN